MTHRTGLCIVAARSDRAHGAAPRRGRGRRVFARRGHRKTRPPIWLGRTRRGNRPRRYAGARRSAEQTEQITGTIIDVNNSLGPGGASATSTDPMLFDGGIDVGVISTSGHTFQVFDPLYYLVKHHYLL